LYARGINGLITTIEMAKKIHGLHPVVGEHDSRSPYIQSMNIVLGNKRGATVAFFLSGGKKLIISHDAQSADNEFIIGIRMRRGSELINRRDLVTIQSWSRKSDLLPIK
jgi:hypothetical protein